MKIYLVPVYHRHKTQPHQKQLLLDRSQPPPPRCQETQACRAHSKSICARRARHANLNRPIDIFAPAPRRDATPGLLGHLGCQQATTNHNSMLRNSILEGTYVFPTRKALPSQRKESASFPSSVGKLNATSEMRIITQNVVSVNSSYEAGSC
jgi:hypothetical protein